MYMFRKSNKMNRFFCFVCMILLFFCVHTHGIATAKQPPEDPDIAYLKGLSTEDFLQTEITSVSKKSEQLFDTASAVFVITQEDLRRTGARNIPEALPKP
jgi:iron complex outermembrane receptor protein